MSSMLLPAPYMGLFFASNCNGKIVNPLSAYSSGPYIYANIVKKTS